MDYRFARIRRAIIKFNNGGTGTIVLEGENVYWWAYLEGNRASASWCNSTAQAVARILDAKANFDVERKQRAAREARA